MDYPGRLHDKLGWSDVWGRSLSAIQREARLVVGMRRREVLLA